LFPIATEQKYRDKELIFSEGYAENISLLNKYAYHKSDKTSQDIGNTFHKSTLLHHSLFILALFITITLGLESYLQYHYPENSLLSFLHQYNLLNEYEVLYQPNRGIWHGIGWTGTFLILFMHIYSLRKRLFFMHEWGMLKIWLDLHIFCGIMGPILITFHTTFKLGGIVAVNYMSMIMVTLSGLFGRYISGLIPRSISGKELSMEEITQHWGNYTNRIKAFNVKAGDLGRIIEENVTFAKWKDDKVIASFRNLFKDTYRSYLEVKKLNMTLKTAIRLKKKSGLN